MTLFYRATRGPAFFTQNGFLGFKSSLASRPHIDWSTLDETAYMESSNHSWRPYQWKSGDRGGPWLHEEVIFDVEPMVLDQYAPVASGQGNCGRNAYCADQSLVIPSSASTPTSALASKARVEAYTGTPNYLSLYSKGAEAIAGCEPTHPAVDLAQDLGDLVRDGLPSIPGKAEGNVGNEYLNLQFGWAPNVRDGRDLIGQIRKSGDTAQQLVRDSGRLVRRSFHFPDSHSVSSSSTSALYPGYWGNGPSTDMVRTGVRKISTTTDTKMWFSGAFTYHVPHSALGRTVYSLDKNYGLVPGLDTAWEITPYSWLVDWFSNAGSVVHNLSAFISNGMIMKYGYLMKETTTRTDYSWTGSIRDFNGVFHTYTLVNQVYSRQRVRIQATPYGFGLDWNGFSPFQLSILAALGIALVL